MAIAVELKFPGATTEQYDEVIKRMGFTPEGKGAPQGMFHWVTQGDDGLRVVDVWESREAFERFAAEKIGPITKEVGVEGEPEVQFHEVHNYLTAG